MGVFAGIYPSLVLYVWELMEVIAKVFKRQIYPLYEKLILLYHLIKFFLHRFSEPLNLNHIEPFKNTGQEVLFLKDDL